MGSLFYISISPPSPYLESLFFISPPHYEAQPVNFLSDSAAGPGEVGGGFFLCCCLFFFFFFPRVFVGWWRGVGGEVRIGVIVCVGQRGGVRSGG